MRYLLDTNALIAILNGNQAFIDKLKQHSPRDFGVPAVVMFELFYGAHKSQRVAQNLQKLAKLPFEVLPFDFEDAQAAGEIRAVLSLQGKNIGAYDVQIAGQALNRKLILVTHNVKEFIRVAGLSIEDWE